MKILLGLCIAAGILLAMLLDDLTLVFVISLGLICISIMIYLCYKKLQTVEEKIDNMNEKDKSENNNKE